MIDSIYAIQYSNQPLEVLRTELKRITSHQKNVILHTLHRSRNRGIEQLFSEFPTQRISTTLGYWTEDDLKIPNHPLKGKTALRLKSGLFYSLAPEAIRFQVQRSLETSKLNKIDYLWIEDPDLLLEIESDPTRLAAHFQQSQNALNELKSQGVVDHWGWQVRSARIFHALEATPHLFPNRAIITFNPFENGMLPVIQDFERRSGAVWIDRGFTAVIGERLMPLIPPKSTFNGNLSANECMKKFQSTLEHCLDLETNADGWAHQLSEHWAQIPDRERWESLKNDQLMPALESRKRWDHSAKDLLAQYEALFEEISMYFHAVESEFIQRWDERWPKHERLEPLLDRLTKLYLALPGVTGVLYETKRSWTRAGHRSV